MLLPFLITVESKNINFGAGLVTTLVNQHQRARVIYLEYYFFHIAQMFCLPLSKLVKKALTITDYLIC